MKAYATILIAVLFTIAGIGAFAVVVDHSMGGDVKPVTSAFCLGAAVSNLNCDDIAGVVQRVVFHFNALKIFSSAFILGICFLLINFLFIGFVSVLRQNGGYAPVLIIEIIRVRIRGKSNSTLHFWCSLFENSPGTA